MPTGGEANKTAIDELIRRLAADGRGGAALCEAARWRHTELLEELLATGLPVDARSESGATPLMLAASGGQTAIVHLLIERGADVNALDETQGNSPLIWCLAARQPKRVYLAICKALLDAGASLRSRANDGRTALDWARDGRPQEVVAFLESAADR